MKKALFSLLFLLVSLTVTATEKLISINLMDRHGMAQTISEKDRLSRYQKVNFLAPQPYQKVFRLFERDKQGNSHAIITSYHPNGELKQYLDVVNSRAYGRYREWFANGQLKIDGWIISGTADLLPQAQESWLFDDKCYAWNEEGHLVAEIHYNKGELHGESYYFHESGNLWKQVSYVNNLLHGTTRVYLENGKLFQTTDYAGGIKEGYSIRYWDNSHIAFKERYQEGLLMEGSYFDEEEKLLSSIQNGKGFRALLGKKKIEELHEYRNGIQEGKVTVLDENGKISSTYTTLGGEKEGVEIRYFPSTQKTHLLFTWHQGLLQGPTKTWYENEILESQKEMSQNKKNGPSSAWYRNGSLHLVEEYENDRLISGEYYRMNENIPVSRVEHGKGVASLFDPQGNFLNKIRYHDGKPIGE